MASEEMDGVPSKEEFEKIAEEYNKKNDVLMKVAKGNELFNKSKALHKEYEYQLFTIDEGVSIGAGQRDRMEEVNGEPMMVLYNFDRNGLIHSEVEHSDAGDYQKPAIEYPGHMEYWTHGLIDKVRADGGHTIEIWKDGVPVEITTSSDEE